MYIANQEILNWIVRTINGAKSKSVKFAFIEDNSIQIRCQGKENCPPNNFCSEGFCFERTTVSNPRLKQRLKPNPDCPEETPCKARGDQDTPLFKPF